MGIYTGTDIFGIRIYNFNKDDCINILYEKKYNEHMNKEQLKNAYLFYNDLIDKNIVFISFYKAYNCTFDNDDEELYEWFPISLITFIEKTNIESH
jgi:hypothetical protein